MERGARYAMPGTLVTLLGVQYCNNFCYCTQARAGIFVRNLKVTQTPLNQSQRTPTISTRQSQPMFTVSQPSRTPNRLDSLLQYYGNSVCPSVGLSVTLVSCVGSKWFLEETLPLAYPTLCLRVLSLST